MTESFDTFSLPDTHSAELRERLANNDTPMATEALELICSLLLLRSVLIVVLQATDMPAIAIPYAAIVASRDTLLRVRQDDDLLPGVLQVLLPGGEAPRATHALTGASSPTPGAGYDSEAQSTVERLTQLLQTVRRALTGVEALSVTQRTAVLGDTRRLIDANLRS